MSPAPKAPSLHAARAPDSESEERRRLERLAAMGTMVAGFAHEVRNPVASLRSIAESLQEELLEQNLRPPHLARMLRVLDRIERLVTTSLQFGRPAPPRFVRCRPATLLSLAVDELARQIDTPLGISIADGVADVNVDENQLVQVLVILLSNAIDASGSARRVFVDVSDRDAESDRTVCFEVVDEGTGIAPGIATRIFDPFFTTKASGMGLGLSIAQQLVTENGGALELALSHPGRTVFRISLPAA